MTATVTSPETACEQTRWLPSPVPRVVPRTYGKHSDTRWLDDVAVTVAELLSAHATTAASRGGVMGIHNLDETLADTLTRRLDIHQRLYDAHGDKDDLASVNAYRAALADLNVSTEGKDEQTGGAS